MQHTILDHHSQRALTKLFTAVFNASAGSKEGKAIGNLVSALSADMDNRTIIGFGSHAKKSMVGSIFLTRLQFNQAVRIYLLGPVAVHTKYQGKGIGQALINFGLETLKNRSVDAVVTYGDPSFYSKVGFQPLSESIIQAPLALSMPHGWLGQSLTQAPIPTIAQHPSCVKAFDHPIYW